MRPITLMSVSLLLLTLLTGSVRADDKQAAELAKLAGTYTFQSIESNGAPIPADALKNVQKMRVVIKGNTLTMSGEGEKARVQTISINASKDPKQIDITREDEVDSPKGKEKGKKTTSLGIYSLEGKTLKICTDDSGSERPTSFATKKNSPLTLAILKQE